MPRHSELSRLKNITTEEDLKTYEHLPQNGLSLLIDTPRKGSLRTMDADVLRSVVEKLEYSLFYEELVSVSRSREDSWWSAATRESWSCSQL